MLRELRIENLVLIERAQLRLGPGLNAITGETGAGKTMLAHAIDLLLGGKSRKGVVRPGASEAYVEGVFELPPGLLDDDEFTQLRERLPDEVPTEISLARRVTADGRTRAFIEGRSATAADLRDLGSALVTFYGQHDHRKLMLTTAQTGTLDGFIGATQLELLVQARGVQTELLKLRSRAAELEELDGRRERELGLVEFELDEIEQLQPSVAEFEDLRTERDRLRAVDVLREGVAQACDVLAGEGENDATTSVALAASALTTAAAADPSLGAPLARIIALGEELADVNSELRDYGASLSADPQRLELAEERLDLYERLIRKHGGSIDAVLAYGSECLERRDLLQGTQEEIEQVERAIAAAETVQQRICTKLTKARKRAAPMLAEAVVAQLADLSFADAQFEIEVRPRAGGPGSEGCDEVEFLIAPNPGLPLTALRETASGGELSRVMLALLTAAGADSGGTFVFDEIDAGIGGRTARAVGEKLRDLGGGKQVVCITHLPQVAAMAQNHFQIVKHSQAGETVTEVRTLQRTEVVEELCRMLGAGADDLGARRHAKELLAAA